MPTLINTFNFGTAQRNANPELTRQLSAMYSALSLNANTKISKYSTDGVLKPHVNPPANNQFNKNFEICDIYVRTDTDTAWIMTSRTTDEAVTWTQIT